MCTLKSTLAYGAGCGYCLSVCSAARARIEAEKAQRAEAKALRRQANVQRHEQRLLAEKEALRALQAVNRAKRTAFFEMQRRKRVQWLQALHEDSKNWIAESEVDTVRCSVVLLVVVVGVYFAADSSFLPLFASENYRGAV